MGYSLCLYGLDAKAIPFAKSSVWVKKQSTKTISKTNLQTQYSYSMEKRFEKLEHFEYRKKWPPCKGYSLCKIISLRQKMKLPKTCEKRICIHNILILCKKTLKKKPKNPEGKIILKMRKNGLHAKAIGSLKERFEK